MAFDCEFPTVVPGADSLSIPSADDTCDDIDRGYYSTAQSYTAACPDGYTGDPVTVAKSAHFVFSYVSQEDADAQALAVAREEAEALLSCTLIPVGPMFASDVWSSYSGSGTLYGTTEFVVDAATAPPRKYKVLRGNNAGAYRTAPSLSDLGLWPYNETRFDTDGTQLDSMKAARGDQGSAASEYTMNSYEDLTLSSDPDWSSYVPDWQRTATTKWFEDWLTSPAGQTLTQQGKGRPFNRQGASIGSSCGIYISHPTWVTDHWECTVTVGGDGVITGFAPALWCYRKVGPGNAHPGTVTTSDEQILFYFALSSNGAYASGTFSFDPDSSAAFLVRRGSAPEHLRQFVEDIGTSVDDQPTDFAFHLYFPEAQMDLDPWRYAEHLSDEDTWVDAMQRTPDYTVGALEYAETPTYTGGTTAGSYDPVDFELTATTVTQGFSNLTPGNTYRWALDILDTNLTTSATSTFSDTVDFVAAGSTDSQTYSLLAPVGFRREILTQTIEEL